MRTSAFTLVLATTLAAIPATAQWKALDQPTNKDDNLFSVDVLTDQQFVIGGMRIDQSSGFPMLSTVLYRTQDGGKMTQPLTINTAGGFGSSPVMDLSFVALNVGWAAMGGDVWRTTDGTTFKKAVLAEDGLINAIERLDEDTGVAVGSDGGAWRTTDGGATWTKVETGTTANIGCVQFVDSLRGWAAGGVRVTTQDDQTMQDVTSYGENVVLGTSDGGASWNVLHRFVPDESAAGMGGRVSCPMFFLPGGATGWLVQSIFDTEKQQPKDLMLSRTEDGGLTWRNLDLDVRVGTLNFMMKVPINMSYAAGMYWSDDGHHGRLSGAADTGLTTSSGQGSPTPIYKLVDMTTSDGGATWDKPDFGEITMDITGSGQGPAGDFRPLMARFNGWYQAVMVGEKGTVWTMGSDCAKTSDCLEGYECKKPDPKVHARCYPIESGPDGIGSEGTSDRDAMVGRDVLPEGTGSSVDIVACEGDWCPAGKSGGGCSGAALLANPAGWPVAFPTVLFLVFLVVACLICLRSTHTRH